MKKLLTLLILTSISFSSIAQTSDVEPGKINYLDFKNGFKGIILGSEISTLGQKVKYLKDSKNETKYYEFLDLSDKKIGEATIVNVTLLVFRSKIKDIFIQIKKGDGSELYSVLREAYGMYSDKPNRFMDKYYWNGKTVRLIFNFESEYESPLLWFSSVVLNKEYNEQADLNNKKATDQL